MSESWLETSTRLSQALADPSTRQKMLSIERVAAENGISAHTAEQMLRAREFLERLRANDEKLMSLVAALPYQGVLAAERWHIRNREQMLAYLIDNPRPSIRQLITAERESRPLPPAAPSRHAMESLKSAVSAEAQPGPDLQLLMRWAGLKPFDLTALVWEPETGEYERAHGIEFAGLAPTQDRVALLEGPNSEVTGHYSRTAKALWFNAVSAVQLFAILIVLLPSKAAQTACLTSMPLPPNGERGWPKWNRFDSARGQPRSGPARPATPSRGIILFTTPEGFLADWRR